MQSEALERCSVLDKISNKVCRLIVHVPRFERDPENDVLHHFQTLAEKAVWRVMTFLQNVMILQKIKQLVFAVKKSQRFIAYLATCTQDVVLMEEQAILKNGHATVIITNRKDRLGLIDAMSIYLESNFSRK